MLDFVELVNEVQNQPPQLFKRPTRIRNHLSDPRPVISSRQIESLPKRSSVCRSMAVPTWDFLNDIPWSASLALGMSSISESQGVTAVGGDRPRGSRLPSRATGRIFGSTPLCEGPRRRPHHHDPIRLAGCTAPRKPEAAPFSSETTFGPHLSKASYNDQDHGARRLGRAG